MKVRTRNEIRTNCTFNDLDENEDILKQPQKLQRARLSIDYSSSQLNTGQLDEIQTSPQVYNKQPCSRTSSRLKVRTERSAMILGSIVVLFILTHCYRMALKIYELSSPNAHTIEKFKDCYSIKR